MVTEAGRRPELWQGERKEGYGESLSSMPSLSLPSGENEREGGLHLFKMHKAEHPTAAQLRHRSGPRASPARVPEHANVRHMRDVGHTTSKPSLPH